MLVRKSCGLLLVASLLSACASAPITRHFSLQSETQPAAEVAVGAAVRAFAVQSVNVPTQLDRRQILLTLADGQGVQVLNDYQWASPLADEIHQSLSAELSQRLGVPSAQLSRSEDKLAYWRLDLTVQRFDTVYEDYVQQDISWRLSPENFEGSPRLCRVSLRTQAGEGVEGLVRAHQQLQRDFAGVLVQQVSGRDVHTVNQNSPHILALSCA